jgi:hypothetical protein
MDGMVLDRDNRIRYRIADGPLRQRFGAREPSDLVRTDGDAG